MRRLLVGLVVVVGVVGVAVLSLWLRRNEGGDWVVHAGIDPPQAHGSECAELPHIEELASFVVMGALPGEPTEGVEWTVEGRDPAYEVARCLRNLGATEITVDRAAPRARTQPANQRP